ncbi:hypothetical protein An08g04200 [Aspergillus niger]|uniref:Uncharacterized protein n=2 Tax=Aspergillus niger TaxID=5061 RepID=A2QQZ0_ASPNC|nr:hypothetical protein An08g04200 [Aspergillus niger]CAK39922.1 hypothetical protein An08g04200 [Aspergillus niger]
MALRQFKATGADQLSDRWGYAPSSAGSRGLFHSLGHSSAANDQPPPPLGKTGTGKETSRNQASIRRDSEKRTERVPSNRRNTGWLVGVLDGFDLIINPRVLRTRLNNNTVAIGYVLSIGTLQMGLRCLAKEGFARAMIVLRRAKSAWDYGLIGIVAELSILMAIVVANHIDFVPYFNNIMMSETFDSAPSLPIGSRWIVWLIRISIDTCKLNGEIWQRFGSQGKKQMETARHTVPIKKN